MKIRNEIKYLFDSAMSYCSFYGSFIFLFFSLVLLIILNQKDLALKFIVATVAIMVIEYTTKAIYRVKRPDYNSVKPYSSFQKFQERSSFPSGHSASAALFATLVHLHYQLIPLTLFFSFAALCTGASRIHLKRHRLVDVVGGYAAGIIVGYFVY